MVAAKLSLADFLSLDTGPEIRCEFVDGEIVKIPLESEENVVISGYLVAQFSKIVPFERVRQGRTELVVSDRVRIPDFIVLSEALVTTLEGSSRSTVIEEMPPPLLGVEVVSSGKVNEDRAYRYKRSEYAARGVPECWIVDPAAAKVTVLILVDGLYEAQELRDQALLQSPQFPGLSLTGAKVLFP